MIESEMAERVGIYGVGVYLYMWCWGEWEIVGMGDLGKVIEGVDLVLRMES